MTRIQKLAAVLGLCLSSPQLFALEIDWFYVNHEVNATSAITSSTENSFTVDGVPKSGENWLFSNINQSLDQNLLQNFYAMVPEGVRVDSSLLASPFKNLSIKPDFEGIATVKVAFLNEGAGYRNALGYFIYQTDNPPQSIEDVAQHVLIFPNSSKVGYGGALRQGDQVDLNIELKAGESIGFFINSNGWERNLKYGYQKNYFDFGQPFYTLTSLNPDVGLGNKYHVMFQDSFSSNAETGFFAYGFEDIKTTGGDKDFNDLIFNVEITPLAAIDNLEQSIKLRSASDTVVSKYGKLAFEDNWPLTDDYDFNDAVLSYKQDKVITNVEYEEADQIQSEDIIKALEIDYKIEAIGAVYQNGLGLALPGIQLSQVESIQLIKNGANPKNYLYLDSEQGINVNDGVTLSATSSSVTVEVANGQVQYDYPLINPGEHFAQDYLYITLSENLFEELSIYDESEKIYDSKFCFYQTVEGNQEDSGACPIGTKSNNLSLIINFKNSLEDKSNWVALDQLNRQNLDHFLFAAHKNNLYPFPRQNSDYQWFSMWKEYYKITSTGPGESLEIHLKEYSGTLAFEANGSYRELFSDDDYIVDASKSYTTPFITDYQNLPWALDLPITWKHPNEFVDINYAYPNFKDWLQNPNQFENWYQTNIRNQFIYDLGE